jgi:hypothetical protein
MKHPTCAPAPPVRQGITLKLRYNRAGHLFEFPVLLSSNPLDWPVLAAAYLAPPLLYLTARDLVVGPLRRRIDAARAAGERRRHAAAIGGELALARSAAKLLAPVAARRLAQELRGGGLVVVLALYGEEAAVLQAARGAPQRMLRATAAAAAAAQGAARARQAQQPAADASEEQQQQQQQEQGGQLEQQAGPPADGEAAGAEDELLPVADVTVAVQYMTEGGRVVFHTGKRNAPAPGTVPAHLQTPAESPRGGGARARGQAIASGACGSALAGPTPPPRCPSAPACPALTLPLLAPPPPARQATPRAG